MTAVRTDYLTLHETIPVGELLSSEERKVLEIASAAFPFIQEIFRQNFNASHLPEEREVMSLCYLSLLPHTSRKPFSKEQEAVFRHYFTARRWTAQWLSPPYAIPSFFFSALTPAISFIALAPELPVAYQAAISASIGAVGVAIASYAGWKITGTYPDASSTAANVCQDALSELEKTYSNLAGYLLGLYLSEASPSREFAKLVATSIRIDTLKEPFFTLIEECNKGEPDLHLSQKRINNIFTPLEEVCAYINTEGANVPNESNLRTQVELHLVREEVTTLRRLLMEKLASEKSFTA